jgi:hypothetical protein
MTVVSLVSVTGAPGVTTLALAAAAALRTTDLHEPVLVEASASGGVVADWYDLPFEPGLTSLSLAVGGEPPDLLGHAQELPGGVPVVVAPPSGSRTAKLLDARVGVLARFFDQAEATVVVDGGRIDPLTPLLPILDASALVGLVVRPGRSGFRLAATALVELNQRNGRPLEAGWILVGPNPWSVDDIVTRYGFPVLASIAHDPDGADGVAGVRKLRRRSPLARSAASFADDLARHLRTGPRLATDAPLAGATAVVGLDPIVDSGGGPAEDSADDAASEPPMVAVDDDPRLEESA